MGPALLTPAAGSSIDTAATKVGISVLRGRGGMRRASRERGGGGRPGEERCELALFQKEQYPSEDSRVAQNGPAAEARLRRRGTSVLGGSKSAKEALVSEGGGGGPL